MFGRIVAAINNHDVVIFSIFAVCEELFSCARRKFLRILTKLIVNYIERIKRNTLSVSVEESCSHSGRAWVISPIKRAACDGMAASCLAMWARRWCDLGLCIRDV